MNIATHIARIISQNLMSFLVVAGWLPSVGDSRIATLLSFFFSWSETDCGMEGDEDDMGVKLRDGK